jgi:hypothetical protein
MGLGGVAPSFNVTVKVAGAELVILVESPTVVVMADKEGRFGVLPVVPPTVLLTCIDAVLAPLGSVTVTLMSPEPEVLAETLIVAVPPTSVPLVGVTVTTEGAATTTNVPVAGPPPGAVEVMVKVCAPPVSDTDTPDDAEVVSVLSEGATVMPSPPPPPPQAASSSAQRETANRRMKEKREIVVIILFPQYQKR